MAVQGGFSQTVVAVGLGETDIVVPDAGIYNVDVKHQIPQPTASAGSSTPGPSQVLTLVKLNSTTKLTSAVGANGAWVQITAAAGDTLKVITSSSLAADNVLNAVKTTVAVSVGQGY